MLLLRILKNKISRILMIVFANHALDHLRGNVVDPGITNKVAGLGAQYANDVCSSDFTICATKSVPNCSHAHLVKRSPCPFLVVQAQDRCSLAPPVPQVLVRRPISDWLQRVPMISFVEIVEHLEDTMGVDIRLGAPLHSHLNYPNFFALAVNRFSRFRRSRSTPTAHADFTRNCADSGVGSKSCPSNIQKAILSAPIR